MQPYKKATKAVYNDQRHAMFVKYSDEKIEKWARKMLNKNVHYSDATIHCFAVKPSLNYIFIECGPLFD